MLTEAAILSTLLISSGTPDLRLKKEEINRVETLSPKKMESKEALTFSQLVNNERGIESQTSCAFCGAKRISINGLKGEHTTILVDGLPLHSTVSSFYAVDAIPLGGIDSIDIYRGAGQALSAPESIGGAINILTKDIVANELSYRVSGAQDQQKNISVVGTRKIGENAGLLLGVQTGESFPQDQDGNGISEIPRQRTSSLMAKWQQKTSANSDLNLRFSYAKLRTIGGSMFDTRLSKAEPVLADYTNFPDGDVRNRFNGREELITDNVSLDRYELAAIQDIKLDDTSTLKVAVAGAFQAQNAIYSHGYDYDNRDSVALTRIEYQKALGERHLLTAGLDVRREWMESKSVSLYDIKNLKADDLIHSSTGLYLQDTWIADENNEWAFALRADDLKTEWTQLSREVHKPLLAPRIFYKHKHNDWLTSRLSAGLGYRSPLTLFESQHGNDHNGFILNIDSIETAESLTYSLAGQWQDDFFEAGMHLTNIRNMSYGEDHAITEDPTIFKNSAEAYLIKNFDLSYGRRLMDAHDGMEWTVEALAEVFESPSGYKEKLPVAALEKRFSISSDMAFGLWKASQKLIVVGERDLSAYGYGRHFNTAYREDDIFSPNFPNTSMTNPKFQKAPTYLTLDLSVERSLTPNLKMGLSILNALDYTQTTVGDSPTTWDKHGDHFHLDNFQIWGPLRGRQFFLSLSGTL